MASVLPDLPRQDVEDRMMLLIRLILLAALCCGLAACVTTGDDVGSAASTDAFVKKELGQRGL